MVNKNEFAGTLIFSVGTWMVVVPTSVWLIQNFPIQNQIIAGLFVAFTGYYIRTRGRR